MRYTLYTLLAAALLVSACKKEEKKVTRPFTIRNEASYAVTVDFYNSMEEYGNNTNVAFSRRVEGGQSVEVPSEVTGLSQENYGTRKYYFDAYSDDYTSNSWPSIDMVYNLAAIKPDIFEFLTVGDMGYKINFRKIFLDNTKTRTTWKAVDAVDLISHVSVWGQFSEDQKYLRMTFNKLREVIIEKKVSGSVVATDRYFDIQTNSAPEFSVLFSDDNSTMPIQKMMFDHNGSMDTLEYFGPNSSMYILVK